MRGYLAALLVIACVQGVAAQAPASDLGCNGPIGREASHASLARDFGARNVSLRKLSIGEGETELGTVLFASDSKRRIDILWSDLKARKRPRMVLMRRAPMAAGTAADYDWRIIAAPRRGAPLRLGQSLAQVEVTNQRPFELAGFDWDYSGTVSDWRGGGLDNPLGGCRILVRFEASPDTPAPARDAVSGDKGFSSDDARMRAVKPVIYEMGFIWD